MRDTVLEQFAVDIPISAHGRTALEESAVMVPTGLTAVWLHRSCESFFDTHMIDGDPSGVGFGIDAVFSTHCLYIWISVTKMVGTRLIM